MTNNNDKLAEAKKPEEWRDIKGYEGEYQVSSLGRVKSLKNGKEKMLSTSGLIGRRKHLRITLCKNGKLEQKAVHRIVLETFVGSQPEKMEACHNDGNPINNALSNLRWDTHKNNELDKIKHGTWGEREKHSQSKLKQYTIDFIRAAHEDGFSTNLLAEMFNVSREHIMDIHSGRVWKKERKCCELARQEQDLISYERGREEGEIKERMRCNDILHEVYMKKKKIHQLDFIDEIQGKILNPTSDAK